MYVTSSQKFHIFGWSQGDFLRGYQEGERVGILNGLL